MPLPFKRMSDHREGDWRVKKVSKILCITSNIYWTVSDYILIYGPYILCFNIICQPQQLEYFTVQLATGNGPILVHFLEVGQQQEDGQPGGGANLEPVV